MAIANNVHPKLIQTWAGHSRITTTMDIYGHPYSGAEEELADGLDALRAKALATPTGEVVQLKAAAERGT